MKISLQKLLLKILLHEAFQDHLSQFPFSSLSEVQSNLDPSPVYIKFLFPINKQFGIDSFLDWEGHYWVFAHLHQITATHSF